MIGAVSESRLPPLGMFDRRLARRAANGAPAVESTSCPITPLTAFARSSGSNTTYTDLLRCSIPNRATVSCQRNKLLGFRTFYKI